MDSGGYFPPQTQKVGTFWCFLGIFNFHEKHEKWWKYWEITEKALFRDLGGTVPPKTIENHYHSKVLRRGGRKGALSTKRGGNEEIMVFHENHQKTPPGAPKVTLLVESCVFPRPLPETIVIPMVFKGFGGGGGHFHPKQQEIGNSGTFPHISQLFTHFQ